MGITMRYLRVSGGFVVLCLTARPAKDGFSGVFSSRRIIQVSGREIVVFWLDFGGGADL
ncbi:MAG: hypothetical protein ACKPJD_09865 [Planctomycetaceae bacterium]